MFPKGVALGYPLNRFKQRLRYNAREGVEVWPLGLVSVHSRVSLVLKHSVNGGRPEGLTVSCVYPVRGKIVYDLSANLTRGIFFEDPKYNGGLFLFHDVFLFSANSFHFVAIRNATTAVVAFQPRLVLSAPIKN